jgi:hypothetical protein
MANSGTFSQIYIQVVFAIKGRDSLIHSSWEEESNFCKNFKLNTKMNIYLNGLNKTAKRSNVCRNDMATTGSNVCKNGMATPTGSNVCRKWHGGKTYDPFGVAQHHKHYLLQTCNPFGICFMLIVPHSLNLRLGCRNSGNNLIIS